MLSNKPYLIRAFFEWIVDSKCTPFLVINATSARVKVPLEFVENGEITFNVSSDAVRELKLGNELVEFRASFGGIIHIISAPVKAILAIYAQENGQGMFFDQEEEEELDADAEWDDAPVERQAAEIAASATVDVKKRASHLKLVE